MLFLVTMEKNIFHSSNQYLNIKWVVKLQLYGGRI